MVLKVEVRLRDNDPWPSSGQTYLRLALEQQILQAVIDVATEKNASVAGVQFTKGRSS